MFSGWSFLGGFWGRCGDSFLLLTCLFCGSMGLLCFPSVGTLWFVLEGILSLAFSLHFIFNNISFSIQYIDDN